MQQYLYLILDVAVLLMIIPLSFDKKVAYARTWKNVFLSIILVGIPFLVWDVFFTQWGIWGFDELYLSGIYMYNLPIEEVMFFVVVPFACTFIYACVKAYFSHLSLVTFNIYVNLVILLYSIGLVIFGWGNFYSMSAGILSIALLLLDCYLKGNFKFFPLAFVISILPFLIMNGVLTGASTAQPIVWYNEDHIIGWRYYTIPVEDLIYGFSLLFSNVALYEFFNKRTLSKKNEVQ